MVDGGSPVLYQRSGDTKWEDATGCEGEAMVPYHSNCTPKVPLLHCEIGIVKECVHGDNYINGCRLLAMAGSVTPCGAHAYSWSNYIIKVSILMNYD